MKAKIQQNIAALNQGKALLQLISDQLYNTPEKSVFQSTIGIHFRHNLDHYRCFLGGLIIGHIDYSARARDLRVEEDRQYALAELDLVRDGLYELLEGEDYLHLCVECDIGPGIAISSVQRELEFLLSHTTHHYAIIAIICKLQGVTLADDFGVAPSTLRYRHNLHTQAATA